MRKIFILFAVVLLTLSETFAYGVKVYDEYGNRVGTYKKEGDSYQLYDFNDRKVEHADTLIQNAPDNRTLTEYSQTFYDANMMPIGTWRSGFYGNNGRYYPRNGVFFPSTAFYQTRTPYIVRPHARTDNRLYNYENYRYRTNYADTRYPKFHQFKSYSN